MAFYFRINYCSCGFADNASVLLFFKHFVLNKSSIAIVDMGYIIHLLNVIDTPAQVSFAQ